MRFFRSFPQKPRLRATLFTSKAAMDPDLSVTYLRRGMISILDVIAVKLPQVFTAEILPKLDVTDTLNLAQVNKAYNAAVWSADGVRSLEAKIKIHFVNFSTLYKNLTLLPLYWATKHGNVPAVRALLESGEDVNKVLNKEERTALHVAAQCGHAALVKALIEAKADLNPLASPQFNFLNAASGKRKRTGVIHNVTPLFDAADKGHTHVVMELIKAGADVNQANSEGATPLFIAAQKGHEGIVVSLIQAGVDVRKACEGLGTPLQIATDKEQEKVMALLKFYERV